MAAIFNHHLDYFISISADCPLRTSRSEASFDWSVKIRQYSTRKQAKRRFARTKSGRRRSMPHGNLLAASTGKIRPVLICLDGRLSYLCKTRYYQKFVIVLTMLAKLIAFFYESLCESIALGSRYHATLHFTQVEESLMSVPLSHLRVLQ